MAAVADTEGIEPFRLKLVPILVVSGLAIAIPYISAVLAYLAGKALNVSLPWASLFWLYVQHGAQLVVALAAIAIVKWFVPGDYGLHWPRGKSYVGAAIAWGLFFGVLMTAVDNAPQLLAATKPDLGYPLTRGNVFGWLFFESAYVGPTEEIPFRSLLVTYLALTMPGKLRVGRYDMNWAGVIVALIFAFLHASSFWVRPWPLALGQQIYAFALGILYAYWLEKSKSVLAPIIGHNVSDGTQYAITLLWVAFGR